VCFDKPLKRFKITVLVIATDKLELIFAGKRTMRDLLGQWLCPHSVEIVARPVARFCPIE
jgi:hypothetical protein